jgi:hypothetical protein
MLKENELECLWKDSENFNYSLIQVKWSKYEVTATTETYQTKERKVHRLIPNNIT